MLPEHHVPLHCRAYNARLHIVVRRSQHDHPTTASTPSTAPAEPILLSSIANGIATLTLNRPKQYNALSAAMLAELQAALETIEKDDAVRVVVIAGNGRPSAPATT